jgi:hypothetical protein
LYILIIARRRLGPRALELFRELLAFFGRDLALFGAEVGFVAYDDEGDKVGGLSNAGGCVLAVMKRHVGTETRQTGSEP